MEEDRTKKEQLIHRCRSQCHFFLNHIFSDLESLSGNGIRIPAHLNQLLLHVLLLPSGTYCWCKNGLRESL